MKEKEVVELLNRHAEALNANRDFSPELAAHSGDDSRALGQLFGVASRVKSALRPVAPRAAFVTGLRHRLVREARLALEEEAVRKQHQWIMLAAGFGGLLYVVGVFAMGFRAALWILGMVSVMMGWKKRPAARTAH